jgi:Transposase DDE domain
MFWARLGSLNALRQSAGSRFWRHWLRRKMPSDDSMGRVYGQLDTRGLRKGLHHIYSCLKRNKALDGIGGLNVAVLDGHETHASYLRHCAGCLERKIHTRSGDRTQYYHRNVTLMLLGLKLRLLLDVEPQLPGEDERATALRLLKRVLERYPRAFQVVAGDALYAAAPFVNFLWSHRKYILVVLKGDQRDIYQDAVALFRLQKPVRGRYRLRECEWWDVSDLTSWTDVTCSLRAVFSIESYRVRRQLTGELEELTAQWMWLTNLPQTKASTELVVRLGHARWDIENYGFNELVNGWHADHVYRHDPQAIEAFYLLTFLAFNIFHAFVILNLKPALRGGKATCFWARLMAAEIYPTARRISQGRSP